MQYQWRFKEKIAAHPIMKWSFTSRKLSATVCLAAFLTGCGEQAIVLTTEPSGSGYEVVQPNGMKFTAVDGQGNAIEIDQASLRAASVTASQPMTVSDKRSMLKVEALFLGGAQGHQSVTVTVAEKEVTFTVLGRSQNGFPTSFSMSHGDTTMSLSMNPDAVSASMVLSAGNNVLATISGSGTDGAMKEASAGTYIAFNSDWQNQQCYEDCDGEGGDEGGDSTWTNMDLACRSIARGAISTMFAWLGGGTALAFIAFAAISVAVIATGIGAVIAVVGGYYSWTSATDAWDAGSPSCFSRYGSMFDVITTHLMALIQSLWDALTASRDELPNRLRTSPHDLNGLTNAFGVA